jgi:hypothetical protein
MTLDYAFVDAKVRRGTSNWGGDEKGTFRDTSLLESRSAVRSDNRADS